MTTKAFARKPTSLGQRRLRQSELDGLRSEMVMSEAEVVPEELQMFTLGSLLVLTADLKEAFTQYAYAQKTGMPGAAEVYLKDIDFALIDIYEHVYAYFDKSVLSAAERRVLRRNELGSLVKVRVVDAKWVKRLR
jgi:hypothetical protein